MQINWPQALLCSTACVMAAIVIRPSAFETTTAATPKPTPAPAAKVVVEKHTMPTQPDGYMSEEQCARVTDGMQVADLVFKYGWPASDYSVSTFGSPQQLYFPVHNAGDDKCIVSFDDNKVVSTLYRDE